MAVSTAARYSSSGNSWVTTTSSGRRPAARTSRARSTECRSGPPASPGAEPRSTVWSIEPTRAASLYQIGRQVDLADAGRAEQEHGAPVGHGPQRLGDRLRRPDRLDHVGEAAHQHHVGLAADDPGADQVGQLLEVAVVGARSSPRGRHRRRGRFGLMGVSGQHGHRAPGEEALEGGHRGQPDDPGADHQHRVTVGGRGAQQAVAGDRDRLVQAGRLGRARPSGIGWSIEAWARTCSRPPATEVGGEPERASAADDPAVEVEARRRPTPGAVGAGRDRCPGPGRGCTGRRPPGSPPGHGQPVPASMTRPAISWPSTKGNEPIDIRVGEGPVLWAKRWRSLPQMPPVVTATRAHAGTGQLGLGQVDQRRRERRVGHVELDGTHRASVVVFGRTVARERRAVARPVRGLGWAAVRVADASLDEVRDRGFALVEGFLAPDELTTAAQQALWLHFPRPEEYFADPARYPGLRRGPVRRRRGVPLPVVGPQPPGLPPRSGRCRRALPRHRRTSTCTRWSCGPSTPAPPTTTNPCTATTAATAWWSPVPTDATSS